LFLETVKNSDGLLFEEGKEKRGRKSELLVS